MSDADHILILYAMWILRISKKSFICRVGWRSEEKIKGCRCNYLDLSSEWIITRGHWNVTFNNEGR